MSKKDSKIEKTPEPSNGNKFDSLMEDDIRSNKPKRRVKKNYFKGSRIPIEMS
jgi:hypothetical protein